MNAALHIVPQLPPAVDGVGDYCANLWRHWPEPADRWQFAALHGAAGTRQLWPEATVREFRPNSASLFDALESSAAATVVLHYVGYGYQAKGIPIWLPAALEQWRRGGSRRLVTIFHEMYANSSPLRSPFWVRPWARQIIRRLVDASDVWVTSCARYFEWLVQEFRAAPERGARFPIPSNVPPAQELVQSRPWPLQFGRKLRVVVFGLPNTRLWALESHARLLRALVEANVVDSVLLLGKGHQHRSYNTRIQSFQRQIGGQWQGVFDLPPQQIADTLADCDIGLVANDPGTLTKSGVFAALATNGVVSVVAERGSFHLETPYKHCVLLNDETPRSFSALIAEVRGAERMTARRRATLSAAATELSWDRIAAGFRSELARRGILPPGDSGIVPARSAGALAAREAPV